MKNTARKRFLDHVHDSGFNEGFITPIDQWLEDERDEEVRVRITETSEKIKDTARRISASPRNQSRRPDGFIVGSAHDR